VKDATQVAIDALARRSRLYDPGIASDIVADLFSAGLLVTPAMERLAAALRAGLFNDGSMSRSQCGKEVRVFLRSEEAAWEYYQSVGAFNEAERAAREKPELARFEVGTSTEKRPFYVYDTVEQRRTAHGLTEPQARVVADTLNREAERNG